MKKPMITDPGAFAGIARRVLTQQTAPYHEHAVRTAVEAFCQENDLDYKRDRYGNLLVTLRTGARSRPLVLAAHMDHPAFAVLKPLGPKRFLAEFRGGVADEFFRPGIRLCLHPGGHACLLGKRRGSAKVFEIDCLSAPPLNPLFATWDLPLFRCRGDRIEALACDDLIGVTAILATMSRLKASGARVNVIGAISRAEEIGFRGALAMALDREFPRDSLVISLETSRELPGAKIGKGMILRVGDKSSVFGSGAMRFLAVVAEDLAKRRKGKFKFQKALMSGGTCEATAYQEFGYESGAVCVALGNYHNCGARSRIQPERVSLEDACGMTDFLVETAHRMGDYKEIVNRLPERLKRNWKESRQLLIQTR